MDNRCRNEQDCTWEPHCRIAGRCMKDAQDAERLASQSAAAPNAEGLLPCPHCGGAGDYDNSDTSAGEWIACVQCGATASPAAWNRRQSAAAPPIAPVAWHCEWAEWSQYHDASDPLPETWDSVAPLKITPLYAVPPSPVLLEVLEALEHVQYRGLLFDYSPSELSQFNAAIAKLRELMGEKG